MTFVLLIYVTFFVTLVQLVLSEEMLLLPSLATLTAGWHQLLSIKRLRFNQK